MVVVEVVVVLSPLLEVRALLPERVRYRLPSDWLGWRWLVIGAVALSFV